ncbi:MAG: STT3 domain-containing protein, partial [Candidatus Kariarchaeaceae archaeon]
LVLFGILQDLSRKLSGEAFRRIIVVGFFFLAIILGGLFLILVATGIVDNIGDKFISVLLPTSRNDLPLIDSVSEHLPLAWGSLYANLSTLVFFIPLGVFFAIKKPTEKNIFILTFGLTTIYFSGSMVRLMLILAPSAAILTALAIDNLLLPFAYATHGRVKLTKITMELPSIGGQNAFGSYGVVFFLMIIMLSGGVAAAGTRFSTPEITPGGSPEESLQDWLNAFEWMRKNTGYKSYLGENNEGLVNGQPPVMLSWWDYGYYITTEGETISLVDNATSNSTQIGAVGTMLMYNTTAALPLMYMYNVNHVLVVPAAGQLGLGSDIGKSIWMIRISERYTPEFGIVEGDYFDTNPGGGYVDKYFDSVLWQLMSYHAPDMGEDPGGTGRPPFCTGGGCSGSVQNLVPDFRSEAVDSLEFFQEVYRSDGLIPSAAGLYPFIRIFEVQYPEDIEQRVNEFQETIAQAKANLDAENSED